MNRYALTRQAERDISDVYDYVAAESASAALRLVDRLEGKCQRIADMPLVGRQRDELSLGLRSFPAGSYVIFYRVMSDGIEVVRVLHGARDIPHVWEEQ